MFRDDLECVQRDQIFVLVAEIRVPRPDVAAGLSCRRDDRARGLLVFRLEVLRDDPVLLDRVPREGVPAAVILSCNAAAREVILQTRAVDEDVDIVRPLRASGKVSWADRICVGVDAILADADSRCKRKFDQPKKLFRWRAGAERY